MSIWQEYMQYLIDWAYTHNDDAFEGDSPLCYEEWKSNEEDQEEDK